MVILVGRDSVCRDSVGQELLLITRNSETQIKSENIADVRLVPLIGDAD